MELLKKHKLLLDKNPKAVIPPAELKEVTMIETLLPTHALIVFRQLVMKEVILIQHKAQQEKEKSKPTKRVSTFFKNHFGSHKKDYDVDDDDDISIQAVCCCVTLLVCGVCWCCSDILFCVNSYSMNWKMSCSRHRWILTL